MTQALTLQQAKSSLENLSGWYLSYDGKMIYREFVTKDFMSAVDLINRIAKIAEKENHHPDIHLQDYRKLRVELSTHNVGGLSDNDFMEAAKINNLPVVLKN